ncbi:hypothetical protein [Mucilaginibacter sp. KACC 22063]|uniref:hypothetical protein n=1 Tax=Mucilaginibacter sp. KACC 22063 TaxID=3025666 RepID=UPI00236527AF|nr:hypothetical protein [Mucilaginibacter sp. KACC 22063]WDF55762.1 hypothetical protein PQ461_01640 [Mucilaginibacter sp. KACC 22063]
MKINKGWHAANVMPKNATQDQRIIWHVAHQQNCGCRPIPEKLKAMITRQPKKDD